MRKWLALTLAALATLPGTAMILFAHDTFVSLEKSAPIVPALILGLAVIGAAFLLSWACEVAQLDIPATLALSVLALIAVLPEYAVDFNLTYTAGTDPAYRPFAIANMIGANRMIVGFAWPLVVFLFLFRFRRRVAQIAAEHRVEAGFLLLAGLYSLTIPLKGRIDMLDAAILVSLFVLYTFRLMQGSVEEPHLIGPAAAIGQFPRGRRLATVGVMLIGAAGVIFAVAHPFSEALIKTGTNIGVDEVFMVQWFAPLASEAPEIVVTVLFALRGLVGSSLGALMSSKVNQWTLLVGTLPLVFLLGSSGAFTSLPLHGTVTNIKGVVEEYDLIAPMFVTSGQTLLAVMVLINMRVGWRGAALLFGLFVAQFLMPHPLVLAGAEINTDLLFGWVYIASAFVLAVRHYREFVPTFRAVFSPAYVRSLEHTGDPAAHESPAPTHAAMAGRQALATDAQR